MAKRFSIVNVKDEEIFLVGFALPKDLSDSELFVEILSQIPSSEKVEIKIEHCLLLDFPDNDTDISVEEMEDMLDIFDDLVENENIFCEEVIEFEMQGLEELDIVVEEY